MIWDKIVEIDGNRIGILLFEGKDARERAQLFADSTIMDPEYNKVISRGDIAIIIGPANNH